MNKEKMKREAERIKKMTNDHSKYLKSYKQGGDWTVSEYVGTINEKISTILGELEKGSA